MISLPYVSSLHFPTQLLHILYSFETEKRGNLCSIPGEHATPSLVGQILHYIPSFPYQAPNAPNKQL